MNCAFAQKVNTVVLDAGHGGHDTGALGKNSREKDIALSIVLKLRDYINDNMKDVKVILTRDDDTFVELYRRAHIANENKADLFISIHCNSTRSSSVYGVETFVMGLHKSDANLAVAKAENAAILLEDDYVEKYDGFDPNSPEGNIFFSMMQNSFLDRSLGFAGNVQHELADNLKKFNRGVKQAGFLVLYKTAMPSVLIETGFICNANDEKFLLSAKGQDQTAEAIFKALRNYKSQVEKKIPFSTNNDTLIRRETTPDSRDYSDEMEPEPNKATDQKSEPQKISYRVQFATFPENKSTDSKEFKGIKNVKMYVHSGAYKYTAGDCADFESALVLRKSLIAKGYKDAFVVAFKDSERITNEEAKRLTGKK
jgi:N-acetylmuramoyl-L-alanine amidase